MQTSNITNEKLIKDIPIIKEVIYLKTCILNQGDFNQVFFIVYILKHLDGYGFFTRIEY